MSPIKFCLTFGISVMCASFANATISLNFRKFIRKSFDIGTEQLASRDDLGWFGSFGGGNHIAGRRTKRDPVIYIHGALMTAGQMTPALEYHLQHGYDESEVFATSFSVGRLRDGPDTSVKCIFAKEVRVFIKAVAAYTDSSSVNVIAYSLGSAVTRKAILGGKCVDTDENLGAPLTDTIKLYLSVAGVNQGSQLCEMPAQSKGSACNPINGYGCDSQFIADINSKQHYEGRNVVVLRSTDDDVSNEACGFITPAIDGANQTVVISDFEKLRRKA